jgi:hypothetical protein
VLCHRQENNKVEPERLNNIDPISGDWWGLFSMQNCSVWKNFPSLIEFTEKGYLVVPLGGYQLNGNRLAVYLLSLIGLLFVGACQPAESPETETPVPPAAAVELPTATLELPTATAQPPTATPDSTIRILFIGDSHTKNHRGLGIHIEGMAASANPPTIVEGETIAMGGASMWSHWVGPQVVPTIQKGNWNVVVLQENLRPDGYDRQEFFEYTRNFHEEIQNIGAETILQMSWTPESEDPLRIEAIATDFRDLSAELGVKVAPVSMAWKRANAERPDLDLYGRDRRYANISGTYLTTAVLYATIFAESPEGLSHKPSDLIGGEESALYEQWQMSEEDIAFLQRIAWETVVDYQEENN